MKKLIVIAFALLLGASLSFAQTATPSATPAAKTKSSKKSKKSSKKSPKKADDSTAAPK